ncbi:hypothetical protein K2Y00_03250 [Patescibacteria group bacterium]|nr:hypothetical protein [Patescibacteria group bacterium]
MKKPLHILTAVVVLLVGVYFLSQWRPGMENMTTSDIARSCVTHEAVSYHVHPELTIIVNNERVLIPANVGISSSCMQALHTHTADGVIHIEAPVKQDFTVGDFFANWQQPFSATQILGNAVDDSTKITMTVNGKEVDTFENTVMNDKDIIVITYGPR